MIGMRKAAWRIALWCAVAAATWTSTPPRAAPVQGRIVGGTVAAPGEFPWQVGLLRASQADNFIAQFCGGTLVAPLWVVTAAHCVKSGDTVTNPASLQILVGTNDLAGGGNRLNVAQIIVHPGFVGSTTGGDVALVKLASAAAQQTIGLVSPAAEPALAAPGTVSTVTGWGNTETADDYPTLLMKVDMPIVSNAVCNAPASYNGGIKADMLCAGLASGGKDSCQGDSGGPLIVANGSGGFALAGIVSFGIGCADPDYYGVYARVSAFHDWIISVAGPVGPPTPTPPPPTPPPPTPPSPPATPMVVAPKDNAVVAGAGVRFSWSAIPAALVYRLQIVNATIDVSASAAGCGGGTGTCTHAGRTALPSGGALWRVLASNNAGSSAYSRYAAFVVSNTPGRPVALQPFGIISDATPAFAWRSLGDASITGYELLVTGTKRLSRLVTAAAAQCGGAVPRPCRLSPAAVLGPGRYVMKVRARNAGGFGPYGGGLAFTVKARAKGDAPAAPKALDGTGGVLAWQPSGGATAYELSLVGKDGAVAFSKVISAATLGCAGGEECLLKTPAAASGAVSWWVRSKAGDRSSPAAGQPF